MELAVRNLVIALVVLIALTPSWTTAQNAAPSSAPSTTLAADEIAICGTIKRWFGAPKKFATGVEDSNFIMFDDNRTMNVRGTLNITVKVGNIYSFIVKKQRDDEGNYFLVRLEAANRCS